MPRIVEQLDGWNVYVPDVDDNRIDSDPMTVEIQSMNTAEVKRWQRAWGPRLQGKNAIARARKMTEEIVSNRCRNVVGYTVDGVEIETGEDLITHGESDVIEDCFNAVIKASHLSAGLKKNLASLSDSYSAEIPPSDGTAEAASERVKSSPKPQAAKVSAGSATVPEKATPISAGPLLPS